MKKIFSVLLICALLLVVGGCRKQEPVPTETTTLMIYMIGSDLESKTGAGTSDLEEMEKSGVDLSKVNVLVYAGGTHVWHNELADPEHHSLLRLTEQGFQTITTTENQSMGNSQCLTNFLNYGYYNFPADNYALILWDHGNGPVIGYGKDMLFKNDCLTLAEMTQAMEASPFNSENKLAWVGFDACLMASAELASMWAPYAQYLVASQEVEPSFGWDYQFLSKIGTCSTETVMAEITSSFMEECLAYFQDRGYEDRDTTLSCLNLSKIGELEAAINGLFARAAADVQLQFNQLTARRANTRALGRASTGSEYDLVDLRDMAMWLGEMYPQEATALINAIENIVVINTTNAQGLCGVSLYYPFYNKRYYENSWAAAYAELGAYPGYQQYLENYEGIWLGEDKLETATSEIPEEQSGVYTLQLTPEQTENLASAKYYILIRDGEEYFTRIFSSSDVDNQNGLLTAGFDGNVLYLVNDYGTYHIPVSGEMDRVEDTGRYIVPVVLANKSIDIPQGPELVHEAYRFSLNIHKTTGKVTISALTSYDSEVEGDLAGGKKPDAELAKWNNAYFFHDSHRYLTRYENGAILPVDQWAADTAITGMSYPLEDGLQFVYEPLVAGEYYLLFEMVDTQGNRYCSELLPIHTEGALPQVEADADPVDLNWQTGQELLLAEDGGVKVWLEKVDYYGSEGYVLKAQNDNTYSVIVNGKELYWGEDLYCNSYFGTVNVPAGETVTAQYRVDLGAISDLGLTEKSGTMRFDLFVSHGVSYATKFYETYRIHLSEETMLKPDTTAILCYGFTQPALGCIAEDQMLVENAQMRVQLLGIGNSGTDASIRGALLIENLTDVPLVLDVEGVCLDTIFVPVYLGATTVPANARMYVRLEAHGNNLRLTGLESVSSMRLLLRKYDYNPLFSGNSQSEMFWQDVKLTTAGEAGAVPVGELLYDQDGIRVDLLQTKVDGYDISWFLAVTNNTNQGIGLDLMECAVNGEPFEKYSSISRDGIPAGTTAIIEVRHNNYVTKVLPETLSFKLRVMDYKKEAILYTIQETFTLHAPEETPEK